KTYSPTDVESKWYAYWQANGFFKAKANPSKKPYTIVIPPPNVTGVLHMGHMLNNTIQDILIRRKRMQGFEACWVPGTDHASIATEAKVVAMLKEKGIDKKNISREEFFKHAWEWKEKYGGIILEQLKKLGASCDWDRTRFTMEESLSEAVIEVFVELYNKGLIYRGARMINWDPQAQTTVSDEEVIYKESQSKLHFLKYYAAENNASGSHAQLEYFTIATTRPETIMGDVAIAVHPDDKRYKHLHGKKFFVPIIKRAIPIVTDEHVDMEFGTGSLKVTPAHDLADYKIGLKYNLEVIDVLNADGTISKSGIIYVGEDRFVARKKIVKQLTEEGYLIESKDITNKVGTSERTGAIIEPRISTQWFCSMKEMAKPTLENVLNGHIQLHPKDKFTNTYKYWLENVQDWCISRQLWWGHRIPAWYDEKGNFVVAKNKEQALNLFNLKFNTQPSTLHQDEDVLDTWFSSWLWPISVFDGFKDKNNADFKYFYPTDDLVTAPEILFFWVARMIMAGYEFTGKAPFRNVYLTGIVRDKQGRKMSKSLGNSPDPFELIDKYSADGVRFGMLLASPAGNDLLFDEKYCEQGRNFANKIWNVYRLISGWEVDKNLTINQKDIRYEWFENQLNKSISEIEEHYDKYRISDALKSIYKLVWDDFCSWYLEMAKPDFGSPIDSLTYEKTIGYFESILKIIHPVMPFISEELWHELKPREPKDCLIVADYPTIKNHNESIVNQANTIFELISQIRNYRSTKGLSPKESLSIQLFDNLNDFQRQALTNFDLIIKKLANVNQIEIIKTKNEKSTLILVAQMEVFIPMDDNFDIEAEQEAKIKELEYLKGFLNSVNLKLNNEKFVANAKPEVVAAEKKKKSDAEDKIDAIEKSLKAIAK
ncbi:MAG: valine--tRNA ligase, partial [Bacteroidota bacterium]|nr:valine--tRNA ligase [Bacteroidota bacterium]